MNRVYFLILSLFLILTPTVHALELPFDLPFDWKLPWEKNYFKKGERIDLHVNTIDSEQTNLPFSYYSLPFICPPSQNAKPVHLSLGEVLNGDRIWQSDYYLLFEQDEPCRRLCDRIVSANAIKRADQLIRQDYMVEFLIDGLPGASTFIKPKTPSSKEKKYYVAGFPLGFVQDDVAYLHNHVMFVIRWHKENGHSNKKTIVGFEIYPKSVSDYHCPGASKNFANFPLNPNANEKGLIQYTYSVYWREEKDVSYDNRWKMYINPEVSSDDGKMHWFAIINSLVLVSLLTLVVAVVFLRTLKVDITTSETATGSKATLATETLKPEGWRAIANDVFIQPTWPVLLSALGGSGIQLAFTILGVCLLLTTGISGPDHRILSTAIGMFVGGGFFAGFSGVQFFKLVSYQPNRAWKAVSFLAGSLLTGFVLTVILILNIIIWLKDSSLALPFGTIIVLISIYVLLEIPISMIGGFISTHMNLITRIMKSRVPNVEPPINRSVAAARIPKQPFYSRLFFSTIISGAFPFGIIFVEMLFLFKSLWVEKVSYYYMYGFLTFTTLLLFIVILEISIITTYLRLNSGDFYNWQWKAFINSFGSILLYLLGYTVYYLFYHMKLVDVISVLLYLIYASLLNLLISVACGSIGLLTSTLFVYTIYSSVKKD